MNQSYLCRYVVSNERCPYGRQCRFSHGETQVKVLCNNHSDSIIESRDTRSAQNGKQLTGVPVKEEMERSTDKENSVVTNSSDKDVLVSGITNAPSAEHFKQKACYFYLRSCCRYGAKCKYYHPNRLLKKLSNSRSNNPKLSTLSESYPITVSKSKPVTVSELKSGTISELKPVVSELKPVTVSELKPVVSELKPVVSELKRAMDSESKSVKPITRHADVPRFIQHGHNPPPPLTLGSFIIGGPHVTRPHKKDKELVSGSAGNLREVELEQMLIRFQAEGACHLLEKSRDRNSYVIQFSPSDQEWHGPATLQLKVSFPEKYPNEFCYVELLPHRDLLPELVLLSNKAMDKYWTSDKLGGLMFRPFLHWWDKNIVDLLQSPFSNFASANKVDETSDDMTSAEIEATNSGTDEDMATTLPLLKSKKGTEIRLLGVNVSPTLGTAYWSTLNLVLSCSRCKQHRQVELKEERLFSITCERCFSNMTALYHLSLIHASVTTLGYLELASCSPVEVVFQSSPLTMTCLNCSSEVTSKGFFVDQSKDVYCHRCHAKMALSITGVRFIQHQHTGAMSGGKADCEITLSAPRKKVAVDFKDGYPLPDHGLCQHFKKSHRWFRFPCCGRAFPCDECHDGAQDHLMERATRMICGYCSKEQTCGVNCVRCGADLISSKNSSHWEGGQGCRNKNKMSKQDKHKYKDSTSKTTSKKPERVGKKSK